MDWETLLGFVGLYIVMLANLVYNWMTAKRLIELNASNKKLLESNEKVLSLIGDIIIDTAEKREEYEYSKDDSKDTYKIKFNLPTTW